MLIIEVEVYPTSFKNIGKKYEIIATSVLATVVAAD